MIAEPVLPRGRRSTRPSCPRPTSRARASSATAGCRRPSCWRDKLQATTGIRWIRGWDSSDWLTTDYRILYGGIDSDSITQRLSNMNSIMGAVAGRMANEVACAVTAYDFCARPTSASCSRGHARHRPAVRQRRRGARQRRRDQGQHRQHLHQRVLGEALAADDAEVGRTYETCTSTASEGRRGQHRQRGRERVASSWWCQRPSRPQHRRRPAGRRRRSRPTRTTRSARWMAVMTYMLSDYEFLYE